MQRVPQGPRVAVLVLAAILFVGGIAYGVSETYARRAANAQDNRARDIALEVVAEEAARADAILCNAGNATNDAIVVAVRAMGEGLGATAISSNRREGASPERLAELRRTIDAYVADQVVRVKAVLPSRRCPRPPTVPTRTDP